MGPEGLLNSFFVILNFRYSPGFIRPSSHTTIDATVSLPWMVEISKQSMRRGSFGRRRAACNTSSASKLAVALASNRVRYASAALRSANSISPFLSPRCGMTMRTLRAALAASQSSSSGCSASSTGM